MSKWKERIPGIVISVILVAVFAVFMVILLQSKMVPTKLLILGFLWCWRWCLVLRATTFRSRPAR